MELREVGTTAECKAENTTTSAADGVNPFPKSTDLVVNSTFNFSRAAKQSFEFAGKTSENSTHFKTWKG